MTPCERTSRPASPKKHKRKALPSPVNTSSLSLLGSTRSASPQPLASTSSGKAYLNAEPTRHASCDVVEREFSACPDKLHNHCSELQAATRCEAALCKVKPRAEWQRDEETALCNFPFCSTIFPAPSYFSLGPRRHHCRMCGLIFCSTHSTRRARMITSDAAGNPCIELQRVCDSCMGAEAEPSPISATSSRRNSNASDSSAPSDLIVTPDENPLSRCSSILNGPARVRDLDSTDVQALAPAQPWMGKDAVLSLYPLAVHPSYTHLKAPPSAGPLFAPSLSARRDAQMKEHARQSLRQRRTGETTDFWLPGKWGFRREDFDPEGLSDEEDTPVTGVVVDGPFRYRAAGVRRAGSSRPGTPARTPSEERTAYF